MVLGPLPEQNFMVSVIKVHWNLMGFFERPVALILMISTLLIIAFGVHMQSAYARDLDRESATEPDTVDAQPGV